MFKFYNKTKDQFAWDIKTPLGDITMLKRSYYAGCNLILTSISVRWTQIVHILFCSTLVLRN